MDRRYGVDGCRGGWFYFWINGRVFGHGVAEALSTIVSERTASVILVDIPIGLTNEPGRRDCDTEARKLLGRRASSVYAAPCRAALEAESYEDACEVNQRITGRKISLQCWNIVPKIREIDTLLRDNRAQRGLLRESHPELCFQALNDNRAMSCNKKKRQGQQERLGVLERYFPNCHVLFEQACNEFLRCEVARDDIIDAMVCAVTARYGYGRYRTAPASSERDGQGLPMEIVYCTPGLNP